ncbi:hypothetical protein [Ornithinicoccus hortensis]|uniref:Uncharacterized protein n=1 Tax=Ornithinicoccus hortensis TaxID=82346 RepID=A0A542YR47_9MICO|nr:hypothetical protein [Ornithinicoccus hortensis]TQL50573.1 hypothetical protein FB467_1685 [Ornithinicoccus hortensis]
MAQSWVETHGIAAKWESPCTLCGGPIAVGDRIFKLPAKRGGSWVCWTCRWPTATTSLESVRRKLRHRLALHQPIGLNKTEAGVLADALNAIGAMRSTTQDVDELRNWLTISVDTGVPANLSMDEAHTVLLALDSETPP